VAKLQLKQSIKLYQSFANALIHSVLLKVKLPRKVAVQTAKLLFQSRETLADASLN
jgi:hypothetical protein